MKITRDIPWAQLRNIPIDQVARALGSEPKRRGGNMHSCPVCGSSDALNINLRKSNNAVCYSSGCAEHADDAHCAIHSTIDLVMLSEGLDKKEAARWLGERFGVDVGALSWGSSWPPQRPTKPSKPKPKPAPVIDHASALALADKVWGLVSGIGLTDDATSWLTRRGIDPAIAHALGCRDFSPVLDDLASLLNDAHPDACRMTGWRKCSGEPHDPVRWLRQGSTGWRGLAIPSWLAGESAPRSWRWRLYEPKGGSKTYTLTAASIGQRVPGGSIGDTSTRNVLVICEGEPDWLSIHDAARRIGQGIGAIGVCSGGLEPGDIEHTSPTHIILAIHQDIESEQKREASRAKRRKAFGLLKETFPDARISAPLVHGHRDLNDLHKEGLLTQWLEQGLEQMEVAR